MKRGNSSPCSRRAVTDSRPLETILLIALFTVISLRPQLRADDIAVDLPDGVKAVWDVTKAYHQTTPTRERICLNGLWQWQPAEAQAKTVPGTNWGCFKVPGCWPGITDYMQKDCQTVYRHPSWSTDKLAAVTAAWYEREITIPDSWTGRRVWLSFDSLNCYAAVY